MSKIEVIEPAKKVKKRRRLKRSEKAKADRKIREAQALKDGTEVTFLTCVLCGRNRPLKNFKFNVKPDYAVVTVRKGGGRRRGFFRLENRDVYMKDLPKLYPDVWANLKENVEKLYDLIHRIQGSPGSRDSEG